MPNSFSSSFKYFSSVIALIASSERPTRCNAFPNAKICSSACCFHQGKMFYVELKILFLTFILNITIFGNIIIKHDFCPNILYINTAVSMVSFPQIRRFLIHSSQVADLLPLLIFTALPSGSILRYPGTSFLPAHLHCAIFRSDLP